MSFEMAVVRWPSKTDHGLLSTRQTRTGVRMKKLLLTSIAALFLATGAAQAEPCVGGLGTQHTSDTRGIWQCGDVCVRVYGNAPKRYVEIDGVDKDVHFKWGYSKTDPFKATLNGRRCKSLPQTYD